MIGSKVRQLAIGLMVVVCVFLPGCAAPVATPGPSPMLPPPTSPAPPIPPPPQPPPPHATLPPEMGGLFNLLLSVNVTPDEMFEAGDFARIGYVPGSGHIVVAFSTRYTEPQEDCRGPYVYKEYTTDMVETGRSGVLSCEAASDSGGLFAGDVYYLALGTTLQGGMDSCLLYQFDAVTWRSKAATSRPLADGERCGDPMLAPLEGQIDISSRYESSLNVQPPGPHKTYATHHQLFTPNLEWVSEKLLTDVPHDNQALPVMVDGIINFVAGTAMLGDLVVMQYDSEWNYLGMKLLKPNASTPEGLAFDGRRFYVSYLDVPCADLPCERFNVHLAAFDRNWDLLDDIAVTDFTTEDHRITRKPTLLLWNGRIYVAYVQVEDTTLPENQDPRTADMQVHVKVYELAPNP